jgi:hypothetical protein
LGKNRHDDISPRSIDRSREQVRQVERACGLKWRFIPAQGLGVCAASRGGESMREAGGGRGAASLLALGALAKPHRKLGSRGQVNKSEGARSAWRVFLASSRGLRGTSSRRRRWRLVILFLFVFVSGGKGRGLNKPARCFGAVSQKFLNSPRRRRRGRRRTEIKSNLLKV